VGGVVIKKLVVSEAFLPNRSRTARERDDKGFETSVNWEDKAEVERFTFDNLNAEHGAARIPTDVIFEIARNLAVPEALSSERQVLQTNPYHGNIVYAAHVPKPLEKQIAADLAIRSKFVPRV